MHHEIRGALEELQNLRRRWARDGAGVHVEMLRRECGRIEEEARFHRNDEIEHGLDVIVELQPNEHALRRDVHGGEDGASGRSFGWRTFLQQVRFHEQQHARSGQLEDEHALHVEDGTAFDGSGDEAHSECPLVQRGSPPPQIRGISGDDVREPVERRSARGRILEPRVVHGEQAEEPEHGESRASEGNARR